MPDADNTNAKWAYLDKRHSFCYNTIVFRSQNVYKNLCERELTEMLQYCSANPLFPQLFSVLPGA